MDNVIYLARARQTCSCGHLLAPPAAELKRVVARTGQPVPVSECDGCGRAILRQPLHEPETGCGVCGTPLAGRARHALEDEEPPCCESCAETLGDTGEGDIPEITLEEMLAGYLPRLRHPQAHRPTCLGPPDP